MPSSIQLYLIRHGIAAERGIYVNDRDRPLTAKGKTKTEAVARRLRILGLHFPTLLTSPLLRARQTADIFKAVELATQVDVCQALAPEGTLADWLDDLTTWQQAGQATLALVGHEPNLSQWGQHLVTGQMGDRWVLKKAGIIGLQVPTTGPALGHSHLIWLSPPRFLL